MGKTIRLIIVESVNPMDLLQGRTESQALGEICKIIGHEVAVLKAFSKDDFINLCSYISSISSEHDKQGRSKVPLCIHLSAHGNRHGLAFGKDLMKWGEILPAMKPIYTDMKEYDGEVVLIISACGAGAQSLTKEFEKEWKNNRRFSAPKYVFVTKDAFVNWDDALVSWSIFYHQLPRSDLNQKISIQKILDKIEVSSIGSLQYFRWDDRKEKYLSYSALTRKKIVTKRSIGSSTGPHLVHPTSRYR
jgi:hypothetical protein